jgi:MFS transporter, SHS family, lactate transporter
MTSATADTAGPGLLVEEDAGPLECQHLQYANYRAVADGSKITRTHWHIALANGLGWGFDGMDGVIFALISPLIIKDFVLDIPTYRTGFQIWLTLGITGLYFWPWLSDRVGRRTLLAVNIAMFSAMMTIVALSPSFGVFVAARALLTFALNGEWSLGSTLVAETWPAHLRGRVISINRATWCFGASFAGAITGLVAGTWGWRAAVMVPGVIALLAIYVRATCPESPYWVRAQDRKRRIADTLAAGGTLSAEDRAWSTKADKVGIRQVLMPDVLPATLVATFVTCCSCCIYAASDLWLWIFGLAWSFGFLGFWGPSNYGTVGAWMPLCLSDRKALVTGGIQHLLHFLGPRQLFRALRRGLAGGQDRPARRLYRTAHLGCRLHDPLGLPGSPLHRHLVADEESVEPRLTA